VLTTFSLRSTEYGFIIIIHYPIYTVSHIDGKCCKAKKWRNDLAARVHPDKCTHPQAATAMDEVTALYKNMVS
jgi:hypothetical protein